MKKIKNNLDYTKRFIYVIALIYIIIAIYIGIIIPLKNNKSLKNNLQYEKAIIFSFDTGARASRYINYEFFVDGERYQGDSRYYPQSNILSLGDTIIVVYDKTNPNNNRAYRDYK